jgi:N-acetylglucosamine malate deacetylase 1
MPNSLRTLARRSVTASRYAGWKAAFQLLTRGTPREVWECTGSPERVLVLAPHADDEAFACGGTLALRAQKGDNLTVLYLSDGARGTISGQPDASLPRVREQEAAEGVQALGFANPTLLWARLPDGTLTNDQVSMALCSLLGEERFDVIYLPWFADEHPDHVVVSEAALEYFSSSKAAMWMYELWSPLPASTIVGIGSVLSQKESAMRSHASQLSSRQYITGILGLNQYRGFQAGLDEPAEAFLRSSASTLLALRKAPTRH